MKKIVFIILVGLFVFFAKGICWGAVAKFEELAGFEAFDSAEIQDFLDGLNGEVVTGVSFRELMRNLMEGKLMEVFEDGAAAIRRSLFSELRTNAGFMGQILILAVIGAVFSGFAGIVGSSHVSETGFYVVYLLAMTLLAASFFASITIASEVIRNLLSFMQVLLPAYFLAVAVSGSAITSAATCGFTIGAIGVIQSVMGQVLLPMMRIYMILVVVGNLYKEDMISKLTGFLGTAVHWACKSMFGIVVGFHIIQGMVLPQADALKNASMARVLQILPGIGGGAGVLSQIVLGSGILIKNTAGAAAIVILLLMAMVPMGKLLVLMILYYLAAMVIQPVCDKRLVACMTGVATGHGLLLKMIGYALALFMTTIAVICISTNAVWYAG